MWYGELAVALVPLLPLTVQRLNKMRRTRAEKCGLRKEVGSSREGTPFDPPSFYFHGQCSVRLVSRNREI